MEISLKIPLEIPRREIPLEIPRHWTAKRREIVKFVLGRGGHGKRG